MMRNITIDLKKILSGYGFYLCIIFTAMLCFTSEIYYDPLTDSKFSVIGVLRRFSSDEMLMHPELCSLNVMIKGSGSWLSLFIPIISAFSFIPLFCDEYEAKSVRFAIVRSSKLKYHFSRFFSACLCGGLAVMIGYGLFIAIEFCLFPGINDFSPEMQEQIGFSIRCSYPDLAESKYHMIVLGKLWTMFLYGLLYAVPALTITSFIRNKYLVMCLPFFLKYTLDQTCVKLMSKASADPENIDSGLMDIVNKIEPDALSNLAGTDPAKKSILIYSLALIISAMIIYIISSMRRVDCGD